MNLTRLTIVLAGLAFLALSPSAGKLQRKVQTLATTRPNFLFIITDQQRADHMSCAGNPVLKTPHIDSLAKRGRRFERFYVNSAVCQTNRATIMTGQTVTQHGVRMNGIPISLDAVCYSHLLQAAGYETALFGKAHFQNFTTDPPEEGPLTSNLEPLFQ